MIAKGQGQTAFLLQDIFHEEWIQQSIALIIPDSKHSWKTSHGQNYVANTDFKLSVTN